MKLNIKEEIKNVPIALSGISLGFMGISTAVAVSFEVLWLRHIAVLFSIVCLGLILCKAIMYPKVVSTEMKHPVMGSFYPTISMTLMIMSVYFLEFNASLGKGIWMFAIAIHLVMSIVFISAMSKDFKIQKLLPSWFIPPVGIAVAAVTSKPMNMPMFSNVIFYYALAWFIVISPFMIYRLIKCDKLQGPQIPTTMILSAPANIFLASYFAVATTPNKTVITIFAVLGYLSVCYSYTLVPKLIKAKILPGLAPLTFPLSIGVIASQRYVVFLTKTNSALAGTFKTILYVQFVVALVVIGYVVVKAILALFNKLGNTQKQGA